MLLGYKSSTESLFISLPNDATLVSNYEVRRLETYLAFGRTPHRHSPPPLLPATLCCALSPHSSKSICSAFSIIAAESLSASDGY